jgi:hypothetical protein
MAITPTYSWPLPDNDDLVKDGAEAIRDLGNAIDTTVGGLPGAGLVHINTTSFSGVSAVSLPDDTFTSDFQNYRIVFQLISSAASTTQISLRLRLAGSDASANEYFWSMLGLRANGAASNRNGNGTSSMDFTFGAIGARVSASFDVFRPNQAGITRITGTSTGDDATAPTQYTFGGFHGLGISYDSMSFIAAASNFTGNVRAYGYKN